MASSLDKAFFSLVDSANRLAKATEADAVLLLLERKPDIARLKKKISQTDLVVATHVEEVVQAMLEAQIPVIELDIPEASVQDRLTQAVLESVADEYLRPGSTVVAIYNSFDADTIDTISVVKLTERLGKLTARDLKKLETKVPLDTLKIVVDLSVEIGRDGREGKAVGTMFVVGDHRKVMEQSRAAGFDAVKGYSADERSLFDARVREGIKEIAQLDGMFVVSANGSVVSSARIIDTSPVELTMTTGLGSRHFAGAAISKNTKAIAVVVSQSSGTVRIFQNGEVVLRIEPMQRAMKWKDFDSDAAAAADSHKSESRKTES
ncbi:MAG: diadenylate cyclase [Mariniblastus sp.]|nr:diadenylate cyclase [Mariniblastus sp.]